MKNIIKIPIFLCIIFFLLFLACSSQKNLKTDYIKDGKIYGTTEGVFRELWDDYYNRGLSYKDGGFFKEALEDLKMSVSKRDGKKKEDSRMVRTYGMNFINYFPHREIGHIYYLMSKYEEAIEELKRSVEFEPSAKAFYFLNNARKKIIQQKNKDITIPKILLNTLSIGYLDKNGEYWTNKDKILLSGLASDINYISKLMVNDYSIIIDEAMQKCSFKKELKLNSGKHKIDIIAKNLLNQQQKESIIINIDKTGPAINIEEFEPGKFIKLFLYDQSGKISLTINNKNYYIPDGKGVSFSLLLKSNEKNISIIARDSSGNETCANLDKYSYLNSIKLAANDNWFFNNDANTQITDKKFFEIILKNLEDDLISEMDEISIKGHVRSSSKIKSLSINKSKLNYNNAYEIIFNEIFKLKYGKNIINIIATNQNNETHSKKIIITRQIPLIDQFKYKYCIAMHLIESNFRKPKGIIENLFTNLFDKKNDLQNINKQIVFFNSNFVDYFVNKKRFQIILQKTLKTNLKYPEINLQHFHEKETKVADGSVFGTIYKSNYGVEIDARLVDIKTSTILTIQDVYSESFDLDELQKLAEKLARKLHINFPIVYGNNFEINNNTIQIILNKKSKTFPRPVMVIRHRNVKNCIGDCYGLIFKKFHAYQNDESNTSCYIKVSNKQKDLLQSGDEFRTW